MKLLIISPVYPFPMRDGFEVRIGDLCRHLAREFELHYVAVGDHGADRCGEEALFETVTRVPVPTPSPWARLYRRLARPHFDDDTYRVPALEAEIAALEDRHRFDAVLVQTPGLAASVAHVHGLPTTIVDTVDLWWERYRSFVELGRGALLEHFRSAAREVALYRRFDRVVCTSWHDHETLAARGIDRERLLHVPVAFDPTPVEPASRPDLLYAGASGDTNVDAVCFFVEEILPIVQTSIPDARLLLLRPDPGLRERYADRDDLVFLPYLPELADAYRQSRAVVVPLRRGSGIKIKVIEALAHGLPTILTPCAAQGVRLEAFAQREITLDASALAREVIDALTDDDYREALRASGLRIIDEHYRRESAYAPLTNALRGAKSLAPVSTPSR